MSHFSPAHFSDFLDCNFDLVSSIISLKVLNVLKNINFKHSKYSRNKIVKLMSLINVQIWEVYLKITERETC